MSYVGFDLTRQQAPFTLDVVTGDTTVGPFVLSTPKPLTVREILVYVDGVVRHPTVHYTLNSSSDIEFTQNNGPALNAVINILHLSHPVELYTVSDNSVSSAKFVGDLVTPSNLTVTGDLAVLGDTTTIQTATLNVEDKIITINHGETGAGVSGSALAGIQIDRGTETNINLQWREDIDYIELNSHFAPESDDTYDLGTIDKQWRTLFSGSSVSIGGAFIKKTPTGAILMPEITIGTDLEVAQGNAVTLTNDGGSLSVNLTSSSSDIIPTVDNSKTLGSVAKRWKQAFVATDPVSGDELTRKSWIDSQLALKLDLTGGIMTGAITLLSSDPTSDDEAARKKYVDKKAFIFGLIL